MLTERDLRRIRPFLIEKVRFLNYPAALKEDLVQETLIYLWDERQHYDPARDLFVYAKAMLRSMRNCLVELHRLRTYSMRNDLVESRRMGPKLRAVLRMLGPRVVSIEELEVKFGDMNTHIARLRRFLRHDGWVIRTVFTRPGARQRRQIAGYVLERGEWTPATRSGCGRRRRPAIA